MAQYTLYPSNCDYVNVAKALILKFPFLRDVEGNGYHTWHMSLKRKFKSERAPLVSDEEVKRFKERFGHGVKRHKPAETTCQRIDSPSVQQPDVVGEDSISVDAHVKILQEQYQRTQPDNAVVNERMTRTFHWRRREITHGMMTAQAIEKYPFLRTATGLCQEVGRIHKVTDLNLRFRENFSEMVPSLLKLLRGKSTIEKAYADSRGEALVEDTIGMDFKAALILLPTVFKEKLENYISLGKEEPATPYPIVQLLDSCDWKKVFCERRNAAVVKMEGLEICRTVSVEDAILAAFCAYFTFNLAYPPHIRNTLTFIQRHVLKVSEAGDKPLPTALTRIINLLA
ncbi:sterile alpha motif domain-containing protein 3-like isoform X1 [Astyanax mexicanus]|uniref:Sterile alpha motif domain-containing protein 3-like isoform X1 n=1 Tax=Astyanax mexicanus TaxID=7994 RepID=A0A8T2LNX4_ASTMX|nr:sterile alpha motif domain-containing protein 3-like isoform X1 [Astyanax mexicanus]